MRKLLATLFAVSLLYGAAAAEKIVVPLLKCDGKPGSVLNAAVPEQSGFVRTGLPAGVKAKVQTHVKMFHDGKYLYLGVRCDEPAMDKLAARPELVPQKMWENDTIEFNYDPDGRNQALGKIFVDTAGNVVDMFGYDDNTGSDRFTLEFCRKSRTKLISLVKNADNWTVELAIPLGIFYTGTKKDKLAPRINIARNRRSAERESSDLSQMENGHNRPRLYPECSFDKLDLSRYGFGVENPKIENSRENGVFVAVAKARILNPDKRFRNLKVVARLLDGRGAELASGETFAAAQPGKLAEVQIPLKPEKLGRCKLEWALLDVSGALLSVQVMDAKLSYSPVAIRVTDPPYRNNVYATMKDFKTIKAEIALSENHGKPLTVTLAGPDYRKEVVIPAAQAVNKVEFPFENAKEGVYTLTAGEVSATIRKLPPHPGEVRIGKDGVFYVDGKKFLPYGQSNAWPHWHPRGVNLLTTSAVWKTTDQAVWHLNRLRDNGLHGAIHPYYAPPPEPDPFDNAGRMAGKLSDKQKLRLKELVDAVKDHPMLFSYYVGDEPEGWGHNEDWYEDLLAYLQELDPFHPVTLTNYGPDGQRRFYRGCDYLGPDIYPNYFKDGSTVLGRRSSYDYAKHATALRPAMFTLQGFDWGKKSPTGAGSRAPTFDELHEQTYSVFLAGSNGLKFYCGHSWGCYSYQLRIGKDAIGVELDLLKDFLLAPTENTVKASGNFKEAEFLCGMKRFGNDFIIIAVNLGDQPCETTFTSSVKLPAELAVFGEKCKVATDGKTFRDRVEPHSGRIYGTSGVPCNEMDFPAIRQQIRDADASRKQPGNLAAAGELTCSEIFDYGEGKVPPGVPKITCSSQTSVHRKGQGTQYFLQDGIRRTAANEVMTWTPAPDDKEAWAEIDFGKEVTVGRTVLYMVKAPDFGLIRDGRIQIPEGDGYRTVAEFKDNDEEVLEIKFAPVKTRKLRLRIDKDVRRWKRVLHEWEVYER